MFKNLASLAATGLLLACSISPGLAQDYASVGGQNDQPTAKKAIFNMVYGALAAEGVPGYAIAIVKDGNVVFRSTFGMADAEAHKKVDKDTIFGLASLTKTFTGLALLHLVDEGKIKPEDSLDHYLKNLPDDWQKLTIFQLASMRAGLPESRDDELPWPEEIDYLEKQPLAYAPGTKSLYSNPSFRVLGSVIEAVSGMPYLDYIDQVILAPLGMHSTGTTQTLASTGRVSCQYVGGDQGMARVIRPKNPMTSYSAGMLASSLDDLCIYSQALLDKKILSKAAYQAYFIDRRPLPSGEPANWAYGWASNINKNLGQRVISMNGGLPGVASTILLLPQSNMAVVALSNMRTKPVYAIARRAMTMFLTGVDLNQAQAAGSGQSADAGAGAGQSAGRDNFNQGGR